MLVFHINLFRCHKQILPELSSCLNTKPEILRTKPDVACKVEVALFKVLSDWNWRLTNPEVSQREAVPS